MDEEYQQEEMAGYTQAGELKRNYSSKVAFSDGSSAREALNESGHPPARLHPSGSNWMRSGNLARQGMIQKVAYRSLETAPFSSARM